MRLSVLLFTGLAACQITDSNPALQALKILTGSGPVNTTAQDLLTSLQTVNSACQNLDYRTTALVITATAPAAQTWQTANTALIAALTSATNNATNLASPLSTSESSTIYSAFADMVSTWADAMTAYVQKGNMGVYNGGKIDYLVQEKVGATNFVQALGTQIPTAEAGRYQVLGQEFIDAVNKAIQGWKAETDDAQSSAEA